MTDSEDKRPVRRSVVVTAMLLVAGSLTLVGLRSWLERTASEEIVALETAVAEPIELASTKPVPFVAADPSAVEVPAVAPAEPIRVVLLQGPPVYDETHNPLAQVPANAVREAMAHVLSATAGVEIMDVPTSDRRFQEADIVAVFSAEPALSDALPWLVSMQLRRPDVASGMSDTFYAANAMLGDEDKLGRRYAETLLRIATQPEVVK